MDTVCVAVRVTVLDGDVVLAFFGLPQAASAAVTAVATGTRKGLFFTAVQSSLV